MTYENGASQLDLMEIRTCICIWESVLIKTALFQTSPDTTEQQQQQ